MKPPPEKTLEEMLQARVGQTRPEFDRRLESIPSQGRKTIVAGPWSFFKPIGIAALLTLGTLSVLRQIDSPAPETIAQLQQLEDENWVRLFSLAENLSEAESLVQEDNRLLLEQYAFQP